MVTFGLDVPAFPRPDWPSPPKSFYIQVAAAAADAGFDRLWMGDHALWHQPRYEAFSLLAFLAGQTELGLGTAVALAPLRRPVWTAKMAATLDHLAGGRFILGLGVGGEHDVEFELLGVDPSRRGSATDEAIRLYRTAWSGDLDESFSPLPLSGDIPIWIGGRSDAALRRAGRLGDGYIGLFLTPDRFSKSVARIAEHREAANRRGEAAAAMAIWCACDLSDGKQAATQARDHIEAEYGMAAERFDRYLAAGTTDSLVERIGEYIAAGAQHVHLHIAHDAIRSQIELLGEHVLPELRRIHMADS